MLPGIICYFVTRCLLAVKVNGYKVSLEEVFSRLANQPWNMKTYAPQQSFRLSIYSKWALMRTFISVYFSRTYVLCGQVCVSKLMILRNKRSELADKGRCFYLDYLFYYIKFNTISKVFIVFILIYLIWNFIFINIFYFTLLFSCIFIFYFSYLILEPLIINSVFSSFV